MTSSLAQQGIRFLRPTYNIPRSLTVMPNNYSSTTSDLSESHIVQTLEECEKCRRAEVRTSTADQMDFIFSNTACNVFASASPIEITPCFPM